MSKITKINYAQKEILGNFMSAHSDLAKGLLPNTSQGKARANQLWEELTTKLNASGPPVKDSKTWRKVYADQKQNVKKKFSFNKSSLKRTGGGPYEEKLLSQVEEQILEAAGIAVSVEGLTTVQSFGSNLKRKPLDDLPQTSNIETRKEQDDEFSSISALELSDNDENSFTIIEDDCQKNKSTRPKTKTTYKEPPKTRERETKTKLLKKNITSTELYHQEMLQRFDLLIEIENKKLKLMEKEFENSSQIIEIKRKKLQMKENEYRLKKQIKEIELQIRKKELEKLN